MSPPGEQAITTLDGTDEAEDASPKSEGLVGQALQVASELLDLRNPLRSGIEPTGRCERVPNLHRVVSSGLEPRPEGRRDGDIPSSALAFHVVDRIELERDRALVEAQFVVRTDVAASAGVLLASAQRAARRSRCGSRC
jgi:hypothetical protein